jgi:hypothetical protein
MKMVFSLVSIALVSALPETMKLAPVVPAPWLLADVSANRALVAKLGTGRLRSAFCKGRITLLNGLVAGYFRKSRKRTNPQSTLGRSSYSPKVLEMADTDDLLGSKDLVSKAAKEVCTACMDPAIRR